MLADVLADVIAAAAEFICEPICYFVGCCVAAVLGLNLEYDGYVLLGFVSSLAMAVTIGITWHLV